MTEYRYDLMGNLAEARLPNEVVNEYTYDGLNRLVQLKTFDDDYASGTDWVFDAANENLLAQFDYDLLLDGKRSGVTETNDADQTTRIDWVYDNSAGSPARATTASTTISTSSPTTRSISSAIV